MTTRAKGEDMPIGGCEALREAVRDCRLVWLAATETEAAPLRAALRSAQRHVVATKAIYTGQVGGLSSDGARGDSSQRALRVALAVSGCDKANVAHALTALLQALSPPPALVLQVGIAGALPAAGADRAARVGDLVLATSEVYSDTGASSRGGWISARELGLPMAQVDGAETGGWFSFDGALVEAAAAVLRALDWRGTDREADPPAVLCGPCVTSSLVTGRSEEAQLFTQRWQAFAESMEGAAAAHICALYQVPFLEVRGISNLVGDRERAGWSVNRAIETAGRAAVALTAALGSLPLERSRRR